MSVNDKIADNNPWYTGEQTPDAAHQTRVIAERFSFIVRTVQSASWLRQHFDRRQISVLDAGCGDGFLLKELVKLRVSCYGFDYNPIRVENARRNAPGATVVSQRDLMDQNTLPESFDVIVVSQVLEHVDDDEIVIRNLVAMLKPGGMLIAGVPNEGCLLGKLRNALFEPSIRKTTDHIRFYTEPVIRHRLEKAGLMIRHTYYESFMWPHQRIGNWLESRERGHRLSKWLGNKVPSQCGGFYFVCHKSKPE